MMSAGRGGNGDARALQEQRHAPPADERRCPCPRPREDQDNAEDGRDREAHSRHRQHIEMHGRARIGSGPSPHPKRGFLTTGFIGDLEIQ